MALSADNNLYCVLNVKPFSGYYSSCSICQKKLIIKGGFDKELCFWCPKCGRYCCESSKTYCVALEIANKSTCFDVVGFNDSVAPFLGASAEDLHLFLTTNVNHSDISKLLYEVLSSIFVGKHLKFVLKNYKSNAVSSCLLITHIENISTPTNIIDVLKSLHATDTSNAFPLQKSTMDIGWANSFSSVYNDTTFIDSLSMIQYEQSSLLSNSYNETDLSNVTSQFWIDFFDEIDTVCCANEINDDTLKLELEEGTPGSTVCTSSIDLFETPHLCTRSKTFTFDADTPILNSLKMYKGINLVNDKEHQTSTPLNQHSSSILRHTSTCSSLEDNDTGTYSAHSPDLFK